MSTQSPRVLIYSHDTFGLGHLRRCRVIAQALVARRPDIAILIIAGSPVVGSFSFPPQVDFIRVPGVVKLGADNYAPSNPGLSIEDLTEIRSAVIKKTAEIFRPDIFLVDKEPLGLRGEVAASLDFLKQRGTRLVLGLRDIMDEPSRLAEEWHRKDAFAAVEMLYDDIWIYGLSDICDPLEGIGVSASVRAKATFTGYLPRADNPSGALPDHIRIGERPFVLVTTGGGGDGERLVDWVLRAYETGRDIGLRAKIVLGPFMETAAAEDFQKRAAALDSIDLITFAASIERLYERASGIVAMGGYNTFCEILSFNKPAIVVPRVQPRLEQYIRASRAQDLGLLTMLLESSEADAGVMADAIAQLPRQPKPQSIAIPGLLDGLKTVSDLTERYLRSAPSAASGRSGVNGRDTHPIPMEARSAER